MMYPTSMPDSTPSLPARLRSLWARVPFRHMTALVIALFVIKEQFPFSNFPMYSNFDAEADVVFVADQKGDPLAMDKIFSSGGSSTAKKAYKKELGKITKPTKRDSNEATAQERQTAGAIVISDWHAKLRRDRVPPGTTALRLYRRTFELKDGQLGDTTPELLAEKPL